MANNNSHTKNEGGGGEGGEAGTQDVEHAGTVTETDLCMHANRQHSPINQGMERHKQEGSNDMEAGEATTREHTGSTYVLLSVWGQEFFYFHFYALFGMLSKGMGGRFLLSKDEPLTPDIDGVMAL